MRTFRDGETFVYRDALRQAVSLNHPVLEVDLDHVMADLPATCSSDGFHLPLFEAAALEAAVSMAIVDDTQAELPAFQITLTSSKQPITIRQLLSSQVSRVVMIPGIVIASSKVKAKATTVVAQCKGCHANKQISVRAGFAGANLPRKCDEPRQPGEAACPLDPYAIVPEKCKYVDMQTWKLQESPEMVPTGEMPRSVMLSVDRHLVDRAIPGNRVTVTGIMSIMQNAGKGGPGGVAIRTPYLQVLGVKHGFEATDASGQSLSNFTNAEEEEFRELAREDDIFERLCGSIAPSIFGSDDVKKAVACLLFGGARKELNDGARLRGDINVLLLGDPSVAKSQFLKFVEKAAPVAVYTSGKGSSAAGLTATVTQDHASREFYLEGGAMVLADRGVCCVEEFDKMREQIVAIHGRWSSRRSQSQRRVSRRSSTRVPRPCGGEPRLWPLRRREERGRAGRLPIDDPLPLRHDLHPEDEFDIEKDRVLAGHILKIHTEDLDGARAE